METLLSHCSLLFNEHRGFLALFLFAGLAGGFTHCLAMCGPVVACQSACGGGCGNRMSAASQWRYHSGRMITYGALGFFAALLGKQLAALPYWPALSAFMMVIAGIMFMVSSLPHHALKSGAGVMRWLKNSRFYTNEALRGALMGFMPCGLIYAALMMAATLENPLAGLVAMWLFVLGTIPALLLASGSAALLAARWRETIQDIGRFGMAFNGLTLLVMAAKVVR